MANVSLDWLAFGVEFPTHTLSARRDRFPPPYNFDWMWQTLDLLGDRYRMAGYATPPAHYVHDAADIYIEAAKIDDPEERMRAISMGVNLIAKQIKPPETEIDKLQA